MTKANALLTRINDNVNEKGYIPGDAETLAMVVFGKKIARARKYGKNNFNAFILKAHNDDDKCELVKFLSTLKKNLNKIPDGTRFQLAVEASGHWSAIDIMVKDGKVCSFILDSIGGDVAWVYQADIQRFFPDGRHYQFNSASVGEDKFRLQIQYGPDGCQIFSEDHLEALSNINGEQLYSTLQKKAHSQTKEVFHAKHSLDEPVKISVEANTITMLDFDKDMDFMARILGTIESKTALNHLSDNIKSSPVGKKKRIDSDEQETLRDYESRHTGVKEVNGQMREKNLAIKHKSDRKHAKITHLLSEMPDSQYNLIQENRQGYAFLENPTLLSGKNPTIFYTTKKTNKYIDNNQKFLIIREKINPIISILNELAKVSTNPKLLVLSKQLTTKLKLYNQLLDRIYDHEKYGIDIQQIKKLEKKLKFVQNSMNYLLIEANELVTYENKARNNKIIEGLNKKVESVQYTMKRLLNALQEKRDISQLLTEATAEINEYNDYLQRLEGLAAEGVISKIVLPPNCQNVVLLASNILNLLKEDNQQRADFLGAAKRLQTNMKDILNLRKKPMAPPKKHIHFSEFSSLDEATNILDESHEESKKEEGDVNLYNDFNSANVLHEDRDNTQNKIIFDDIEDKNNLQQQKQEFNNIKNGIKEFSGQINHYLSKLSSVKKAEDLEGGEIPFLIDSLIMSLQDVANYLTKARVNETSVEELNDSLEEILQIVDNIGRSILHSPIYLFLKNLSQQEKIADGSSEEKFLELAEKLQGKVAAKRNNINRLKEISLEKKAVISSEEEITELEDIKSSSVKFVSERRVINNVSGKVLSQNKEKVKEYDGREDNLKEMPRSKQKKNIHTSQPVQQRAQSKPARSINSKKKNQSVANAIPGQVQPLKSTIKKSNALDLLDQLILNLEKTNKGANQASLEFELDEQQLESMVNLLANFQIGFEKDAAKKAPSYFTNKLNAFIDEKLDMNDDNNENFVDQLRQVISILKDKGLDVADGMMDEETGELDLDKAKQFVGDNFDAVLAALVSKQIGYFHSIYLQQQLEAKQWDLAELGKQIEILDELKNFIAEEVIATERPISDEQKMQGQRAIKALNLLYRKMSNLQASLKDKAKNEIQIYENHRVTISRKPPVAAASRESPVTAAHEPSLTDRVATFMGLKKADAPLKTRHKVGLAVVAVGGFAGSGLLAAGAIVAGVPAAVAVVSAAMVGGIGYVATRLVSKGISTLFKRNSAAPPVENESRIPQNSLVIPDERENNHSIMEIKQEEEKINININEKHFEDNSDVRPIIPHKPNSLQNNVVNDITRPEPKHLPPKPVSQPQPILKIKEEKTEEEKTEFVSGCRSPVADFASSLVNNFGNFKRHTDNADENQRNSHSLPIVPKIKGQ